MSNQTFKWCWYHSPRARSGFRLCNWILFFFFFSSSSFILFYSGSWEEDFSAVPGRLGQGACLWFRLDHKVFRTWVTMATLRKKSVFVCMCVCVRVYVECEYVCMHISVLCVFVPPSAAVVCCTVTCSQISQGFITLWIAFEWWIKWLQYILVWKCCEVNESQIHRGLNLLGFHGRNQSTCTTPADLSYWSIARLNSKTQSSSQNDSLWFWLPLHQPDDSYELIFFSIMLYTY